MTELKPIIEESMIQYAGAVLQSRALVDVRDGLKPSARQILYCMDMCKYTSDKPIQPTAASLGDALKYFYIHGDSSCLGIIMRAGQPFAMRYPLVDVGGNGGSLMKSGNWAAYRYTKARLSKISDRLFEDIDKDTIDEWRDNFSDTKQYPAVLPTKGFYNIVNGTSGIGIGMASSIPQYNIRELNNALIYLIDHPDCSFEDIYCAPDFATGAILYNENEVKQSMKNGTGFACKLRSVVEFDQKDRCFVVTEIPYGVYTETITGQLEEIINGDENPGIDRFNDLTGKGTHSLIKIYLEKKANPDKVLRYLFKNTSLQSHFGINFTMLDMGRFPKVFTWKEMLQAHIDHEKIVYRRGFEFDLKKIESRIHIIDGLLICLARIEEVVQTIKSSASTAAASIELQKNFLLDETQAKAVLDMKLSRLAHLEVKKLENERENLLKEANRLNEILNNEELFNEELKNGWREVAKKFGDERRTKIIQLAEGNDSEPIEKKQLSISFTNNGAIFVSETSTLYSQKRNGAGSKFKLDEGEYVVDNLVGENTDTILFFTSHGNFYHARMGEFVVNEKQYLSNFISIQPFEKVVAAAVTSKQNAKKYIVFVTKNGVLKKSALSEYNLKRNVGATAIKLDKGDEIVSVLFLNEEKIGIASRSGQFIMITTTDVNAISRNTRGVTGMKLNEGDTVVGAVIVSDATKEFATVTEDGYIKRTARSEFRLTGRATKGVKIQNTDCLCSILPLSQDKDVLVNSSKAQIRLKLADIPLLTRGTQGVKSIKLSDKDYVIKLSNYI
jgi:DNA gyrase subunit A